MNVNFAEAQLLMAEIQLKQNQASPAAQTLDLALSQDFEVRENPYYFILKSKIHMELGEIEESIKTLGAESAKHPFSLSHLAASKNKPFT
jgi:tetratricopeptide repeat protein 21B